MPGRGARGPSERLEGAWALFFVFDLLPPLPVAAVAAPSSALLHPGAKASAKELQGNSGSCKATASEPREVLGAESLKTALGPRSQGRPPARVMRKKYVRLI